jgi:hypothetical protein
MVTILASIIKLIKIIVAISIKQSLILLKTKALKAAFKVPVLVDQKFIKKKEVTPIISHPKYNIIKLPAKTNINILITNASINKISLVTFGSYLK